MWRRSCRKTLRAGAAIRQMSETFRSVENKREAIVCFSRSYHDRRHRHARAPLTRISLFRVPSSTPGQDYHGRNCVAVEQ